MADGRMIKREIAKSKKIAFLKNEKARSLYFMIYPHTDVVGRYSADPYDIKAECIPLFKWSISTIQAALQALHESGLIILYEVAGKRYLQITRFNDFQRIDEDKEAKSKIPPPPENSGELQRTAELSPISKDKLSKDKLSKGETTPLKFLEFVFMTKEQEQKLIAKYGLTMTKQYVAKLNAYIGSKGAKYKSHYHTILSWMMRDNVKPIPKQVRPTQDERPNPTEQKKVSDLVHKTAETLGAK